MMSTYGKGLSRCRKMTLRAVIPGSTTVDANTGTLAESAELSLSRSTGFPLYSSI